MTRSCGISSRKLEQREHGVLISIRHSQLQRVSMVAFFGHGGNNVPHLYHPGADHTSYTFWSINLSLKQIPADYLHHVYQNTRSSDLCDIVWSLLRLDFTGACITVLAIPPSNRIFEVYWGTTWCWQSCNRGIDSLAELSIWTLAHDIIHDQEIWHKMICVKVYRWRCLNWIQGLPWDDYWCLFSSSNGKTHTPALLDTSECTTWQIYSKTQIEYPFEVQVFLQSLRWCLYSIWQYLQ